MPLRLRANRGRRRHRSARLEEPAPTAEAAPAPTPRRRRPDLQPAPAAHAAAPEPAAPAEEAVAAAYRVVDRYLEEGRAYAEGQTAWYRDDPGRPTEPFGQVVRGGANVLEHLSGLWRELLGLWSALPSPVPTPPALPSTPSDPTPFHPQSRPGYDDPEVIFEPDPLDDVALEDDPLDDVIVEDDHASDEDASAPGPVVPQRGPTDPSFGNKLSGLLDTELTTAPPERAELLDGLGGGD